MTKSPENKCKYILLVLNSYPNNQEIFVGHSLATWVKFCPSVSNKNAHYYKRSSSKHNNYILKNNIAMKPLRWVELWHCCILFNNECQIILVPRVSSVSFIKIKCMSQTKANQSNPLNYFAFFVKQYSFELKSHKNENMLIGKTIQGAFVESKWYLCLSDTARKLDVVTNEQWCQCSMLMRPIMLDYLSCELSSDKARTLIIGFSNIVSLDICMFSKDLDEGGEIWTLSINLYSCLQRQ